MDIEKYIEKWLTNSLTEDELVVFKNTSEYQSLNTLDKALLLFKAPDFDVQQALARFQEHRKPQAKVVDFNWSKPWFAVAAVILLVIVGYILLFYNSTTTIESGIAQKVEFTLPDGSAVVLNASSTITYNENQWEQRRSLTLDGEAYFSVAKGIRFDVVTSLGTVSVLGTKFNVKYRNNFFEVICYEGLVAVNNKFENKNLSAGDMFRIIDGKVIEDIRSNDTDPNWVSNESSFISVPFEQVIEEFERQYDVSITTNKVDMDNLFTGRFTHDDISIALKSISLPFRLNYTFKDDRHIELSGDKK